MANYIVLEMDLNEKWWDKWFVVGGLSIDRSIQLNHYNYFSMSSVYMLTRGEDMAKKKFFVRKLEDCCLKCTNSVGVTYTV